MKRIGARASCLYFILILSAFLFTGCSSEGETGHWLPEPGNLVTIEVTPPNRSIANGTMQQFTATAIYSDNTKKDLTSIVQWSSANPAVATISNVAATKGLASAQGIGGPITITATDPVTGLSGTARLTVTAATLTSLEVTPANRSIALGSRQQYVATGVFSDDTTQDLTSVVAWSSSHPAVATISNSVGTKGLAAAQSTGGPITITATDPTTGQVGTARLTVTAATLTSLGVTPANRSIALGTTQQFLATGIYSDHTTQDLTDAVTWSSSNPTVATLSNVVGSKGLATAKSVGGPITITATLGPISGTARLTVTAATLTSLGVTPATSRIALGTHQQFIATGVYSDDTTQDLTSSVTWSSSNPTVAIISNAAGSNGVATGQTLGGPITITATDAVTGKVGTARLTVTAATLTSIGVTPVSRSIALGTNQQFVATGIYSDDTTRILTSEVTWTSSNPAVATIDNATGFKGLASAQGVGGPVTITATDPATGKAGTARLTVTAATLTSIGVTPVRRSIAMGTEQQFIATGVFSDHTTQDLTSAVTWTSSNKGVATIDNGAGFNGLATALNVGGPITITATDPVSGKAGTAKLTVTAATLTSIGVTPVNRVMVLSANQQFVATGVYSDATTKILTASVTWTSSNPAVVSIDNGVGFKGLATALSAGGPITITATDPATGITGTAIVTVTSATLASIQVTPPNRSIARGTTQQFVATGIYSDDTTQDLTSAVTWSSSNRAVATIDNGAGFNGLATALSVGGPITITATDPGTGIAGTARLTVTAANLVSVGVTPVNPSIALGTEQQFTATGTYSDGTTRILTSAVTWTSANAAVATIDNAVGSKGLATALSVGGPITITATDPVTGKAGTTQLTVTAATLTSLAVTPVNQRIALGTTQQYIATGTYSDATSKDLTSSVTWHSSNPAIAAIDNAPGFNGLATSMSVGGPITIRATDPTTSLTDSTSLTVTAATLTSIAVTPATAGIPVGATQQFVATGTYSDATTRILTSAVTWTSSNGVVATIDNAVGFKGLATALSVGGPITIRATDPATAKSGTAALTVTIAPFLGPVAPFGGFGGGAGMTNQGILTVITGDIGTTGVSTTMTGFHDSTGDSYIETPLNIGDVKGRIYTYPPPPVIFGPGGPYGGNAETKAIADAAAGAALTAYNYLAGLPGGPFAGAGELGGLVLGPGTYTSALSFKITNGDLTLSGTANDVWVFQMGSSLTVGSPGFPRRVTLTGGAQARNVFWQVGSQARIEDKCKMVGTIIAYSGVTLSTPGQAQTTTLDGRALATNASVTMVNTIITVPAP